MRSTLTAEHDLYPVPMLACVQTSVIDNLHCLLQIIVLPLALLLNLEGALESKGKKGVAGLCISQERAGLNVHSHRKQNTCVKAGLNITRVCAD